jgi:hypothetical protein
VAGSQDSRNISGYQRKAGHNLLPCLLKFLWAEIYSGNTVPTETGNHEFCAGEDSIGVGGLCGGD